MIPMVRRNQSIEKSMLRITNLSQKLTKYKKVLDLNLISQEVLDQSQVNRKGLDQNLTYRRENLLMSQHLLDSR